jgi:hypothetical protein
VLLCACLVSGPALADWEHEHERWEHDRGYREPVRGYDRDRDFRRGLRGSWLSRREFSARGRHFFRPRIDIDLFARPYYSLPRFHRYGTWGLVAPLTSYPDLAFLNDAMLVGTYYSDGRTVYVYVIDEGDHHMEFRVDQYGNVISEYAVP